MPSRGSPVSMGLVLAEHAGPPGTASSSSDAHWPAVALGVRPSLAMDLDPSSFTRGWSQNPKGKGNCTKAVGSVRPHGGQDSSLLPRIDERRADSRGATYQVSYHLCSMSALLPSLGGQNCR